MENPGTTELPWPSYDAAEWSKSHSRHGHTARMAMDGRKASPTYVSWSAMRKRCNDPRRDTDHKYAGRGITYDPTWDSFEQFLADMGERPKGTTLDRVDNNLGYSKANCRWATHIEQARNRRNTRLTYAQAVEVAIARHLGVPCKVIAADYGTSESLPKEIAKGRAWKDANAEALEVVKWLNS